MYADCISVWFQLDEIWNRPDRVAVVDAVLSAECILDPLQFGCAGIAFQTDHIKSGAQLLILPMSLQKALCCQQQALLFACIA